MVDFGIFKNLTFFSTIATINFTGKKSNHSDIDGGKEKGLKVIMSTSKKIFLASSSELKSDRKEFEIFINRKNKDLIKKGFFIELVIWEDFLDAMSRTRLQDEYNKAVKECDIFVMLFLNFQKKLKKPLTFLEGRIILLAAKPCWRNCTKNWCLEKICCW
jgi:hypothetical protein